MVSVSGISHENENDRRGVFYHHAGVSCRKFGAAPVRRERSDEVTRRFTKKFTRDRFSYESRKASRP
jgi:hypothetical protein